MADLIHILILEPSDTLTSVDVQLGFSLGERPIDAIESHPGWHELTWVLSDDGFGVVLYVPNTEPKLLAIFVMEPGRMAGEQANGFNAERPGLLRVPGLAP